MSKEETPDEIIITILRKVVHMTKCILEDIGEFHPICFTYHDDYHNLVIEEQPTTKTEIKEGFLDYIKSNEIQYYAITTNVTVKDTNDVKFDAIEVSFCSEGIEYQEEYIYYKKDKEGEFVYTELFNDK